MILLTRLLSFGLLICALFILKIDACTTADGRRGQCISLLDCGPLYRAFEQQPLPTPIITFLRKSACGFVDSIPLVCCHEDINVNAIQPNEPRPTTSPPETSPGEFGKANELPSYPDCGNDVSDRIFGGTIAELDEYPWMVMMGYRNASGVLTFECGGVLINNRYVLTAAHCVVGAIVPKFGPPIMARVGEYDTNTPVDCDGDGLCAPPHQDVGVEQAIAHVGFTDAKSNREDDIALIRLSRNVAFSRFIKAICLPTEPTNMEAEDRVVVVGWGRTLKAKKSNVKLKLDLPIFDKSKCTTKFANASVFLTDKQLCAGGKYLQDTCYGDSGGPLLRRNGASWETVAVVSFGNLCGSVGWPGVYTDVYKYLPWIKENLRP